MVSEWKIEASPYSLYFKTSKANSVQGFLLRMTSNSSTRFGVLQSWPNLDASSFELLKHNLKQGQLTHPLIKCAIERGIQFGSPALMPNKNQVASHLLSGFPEDFNEDRVVDIIEGGFKSIKIKIHKNLNMSLLRLFDDLEACPPDLKLRLDFNLSFNKTQVFDALEKLNESEISRIDFVEDPFEGDLAEWRSLPVRAASDWYVPDGFNLKSCEGVTEVIKPNIRLQAPKEGSDLLITSYMAHPLEQLLAQSYLEEVNSSRSKLTEEKSEKFLSGGCASHYVFDKNQYSKLLQVKGSCLQLEDKQQFFDLLNQEEYSYVGVFEK